MCWSSGVPGPRMGKGGSLGGWTHQQPHTDRSDCLVAEGGRCGSSLALPAHLAQPGTVLFLAAGLPSSPAYPWPQPGSDSRQHCHPHPSPCAAPSAFGVSPASTPPQTGEGARAELSHAARPGQRPQQGEANPDLPSPRAIKNEAHSAAQLSSDQITASPSSTAGAGNATWTAQHPPAPTPALQAVSPTKINRQVGWQEKAPSSALPPCGETLWQRQQRGEAAAPGGSRRPDRSGMRRPRGGRGGETI